MALTVELVGVPLLAKPSPGSPVDDWQDRLQRIGRQLIGGEWVAAEQETRALSEEMAEKLRMDFTIVRQPVDLEGDPEYVIVTVLEEAGFGGEKAAPAVRNLLEAIATDSVPPALPEDPAYLAEPGVLPTVATDDASVTDETAIADPDPAVDEEGE